ncbi:HdeD family acid-resistance protein [Tomitella biformata]|uniref:HdeD family acid-resistance protein n=1 Tax=Tomitella biformata TaxID=630403 RepID=UPI000465BFA1|nr:HdeD family acid-resistance protein [Tomitella biformata]
MTTVDGDVNLSHLLKQVWSVVLVRGILAILFGVVAVIWPGITVWALVIVFGVYTLVDGIMLATHAIRDRADLKSWGVLLAAGAVSIAVGLIAMFWPSITTVALLYVIAFYAIVFGVLGMMSAAAHRNSANSGWGWPLAAAAISVIFGLILVIFPNTSIISLAVLAGVWAIIFGILMLFIAFRARALGRQIQTL